MRVYFRVCGAWIDDSGPVVSSRHFRFALQTRYDVGPMSKVGKMPGRGRPPGPNLFALLKPYRPLVVLLVLMTVAGNGLNRVVPTLISHAIDTFNQQRLVLNTLVIEFIAVAIGIFVFGYLQVIVQVYASERVAKDMRTKVEQKISMQDHAFIQRITPPKLLTNLTSDIDAIKMFVAQAIASIISSIFLIIGAS